MTTARCWRPGCRRAATITLTGDDWQLPTCPRHEPVARYVTGSRVQHGQLALPISGEAM